MMLGGAGCALGPDYVRPTVEVPDSYRFEPRTPGSVPVATLAEMPAWWRGFGRTAGACAVGAGRPQPGSDRARPHPAEPAGPLVPVALPSELSARRSDILQSEQQLVAANALVCAARPLYFPSLSLTAAIEYTADLVAPDRDRPGSGADPAPQHRGGPLP